MRVRTRRLQLGGPPSGLPADDIGGDQSGVPCSQTMADVYAVEHVASSRVPQSHSGEQLKSRWGDAGGVYRRQGGGVPLAARRRPPVTRPLNHKQLSSGAARSPQRAYLRCTARSWMGSLADLARYRL